MGLRFFKTDSSNFKKAHKNDNGFLVINEVVLSKAGIFTYRNPDGSTRRELRHPDDVLNKDSVASAMNIPICLEHPTDSEGNFVSIDANNSKDLALGLVGDTITIDGDKIKSKAVITHQKLIDKIEKGGLREVSGGYFMDLDETPGTYKGQRYDARQINIRYNHLAVTVAGRQGADVSLRLDSADAVELNEEVLVMEEIEINGVKYQVSPEAKPVIAKLLEDLKASKDAADAAKGDTETVKKEKDQLEARADSLSEDVKSLTSQVKELKEKSVDNTRLDSLAQERISIISFHKRFVRGDSKELAKKTNEELKKEVIKACYPNVELEGRSSEYLNARFDTIEEKDESSLEAIEKALVNVEDKSRLDSKEINLDEIRLNATLADVKAGREPLK